MVGLLRGKTKDEDPSAMSCLVTEKPTAPVRKMASANAGWNTSSLAVQFERRDGILESVTASWTTVTGLKPYTLGTLESDVGLITSLPDE
jgi:hypothetical protein